MKIKDVYQKILRNMLHYNNNIAYKGDKVLKTRLADTVFVEANVPDFIDIPIYSKNLEEILKIITDDTDISVTCKDNVNYLVFDNGIGKIRYRMPKMDLMEKQVIIPQTVDSVYNKGKTILTFNLTQDKYKELKRVSSLLNADTLIIQSKDEKIIRLISYNKGDKNDKQYAIEIEVDHTHFDNSCIFNLGYIDLIPSPDYKMELGLYPNIDGTRFAGLLKVNAFLNDNIVMKYLFVGDSK